MRYSAAASNHEFAQLDCHASSNSNNHGDVITRHDQEIFNMRYFLLNLFLSTNEMEAWNSRYSC